MWKPGAAKPSDGGAPSKQRRGAPPDGPDGPPERTSGRDGGGGGGSSSGGSSSAKKLSGATMGMRFMQRKGAPKRDREDAEEIARAAAARRNNGGRATNVDGTDRTREGAEDAGGGSATVDDAILLELAAVVDVYGVGSDVAGRRSFGGYRKTVRATWEAALKRRTDDEARAKNAQSHVTDEELLRRYEKYAKGRGGGGREGSDGGGGGRKRRRDG